MAILDAPGEDADNALVPARVVQADARALAHRELRHQEIGLRLHAGFDRAPRAVEVVELPRDLEGAPAIVGRQALDPQAHVGQTSGRVEPRPEQKSEIESARARRIVAGNGEQRAHAFLHAARADAPQALRNQDAVVEIERHDVGDRAERDQIEHIAEIRLILAGERSALAKLGPQGKHYVEHHADTRKALARKRAAGLVGIDDGCCGRKLRTGQMVVGDDHLDAEPARRFDALDARDSVVHRDQKVGSTLGKLMDCMRTEPVPFVSVGEVGSWLSAQTGENTPQDVGAEHTVAEGRGASDARRPERHVLCRRWQQEPLARTPHPS